MSMRFLVVEDEALVLDVFVETLKEAAPGCEVRSFGDPFTALREITEHGFSPDAAFLDIDLFGMTGLELAHRVKTACARTNIIFVTGFSEYALEAYSLHARGYLMKPVTLERLKEELAHLSKPPAPSAPHIRVHTFGNFDVFVDGTPVSFSRSKSKEILAYLVDRRGASVTKKELAALLWEDQDYTRNNQIYLQTLLTGMMNALKAAGVENIVRKERNCFSVDPAAFDCDYYRFEQGDIDAVNAFRGEYMSNYSWAEFTMGYLEKHKHTER